MYNEVFSPDEKAVFALRSLYRQYGYQQYKMSKFEEYDLYVKNKNFLISDNIITFTDTSGKLMALKPDVTLSIVKNTKSTDDIQKVYYNENVYRISKGTRSFKEIMQTGLECIGNIDEYTIYEVILLAAKSLQSISEDFVLDISHLDIISSVLDSMQVSDSVRSKLMTCIGEKNLSEITSICNKENLDGSLLKRMISSYGTLDDVKEILDELKCKDITSRLTSIFSALEEHGFKDKIHIDFSVVSDTRYYNGFVFKGFIKGISSSILSGGQYDNLMIKMGKSEKAIGFAVYLDMLERLADDDKEYDVDTLLLYDETATINALHNAMSKLSADNKSVIAQKNKSCKMRYRQLAVLSERGVEIIEKRS